MTKAQRDEQRRALRKETADFIRELRAIPTLALTVQENNRAIRSHAHHWLWTAARLRGISPRVVAPIAASLKGG